ncbi:farnesol dehydrogenase-like [Condylostylus longicornis]|uniref:farnesol dehydrogenase-like n=1 Tax=Condylostylus longicornis TaxID=2530218 RepID=UPI00244E40C8|nr:farnesol dehydrogenase-like [Condylostylus longicornis]
MTNNKDKVSQWENKIAVVTGASSGIGAAIVQDLARSKIKTIALARRLERMEGIKLSMPRDLQSYLNPMKCDVSNEEEVQKAFEQIITKYGGVDILVNNAGIFREGNLIAMDLKTIKKVVDTNLYGTIYCTKESFNSMQSRNVDGHIIIINSIAGKQIPDGPESDNKSLNIYAPTKFALTAIADVYRHEFAQLGTKIKVTSICPGLVDTEFLTEETLNSGKPMLTPEDVSNTVMYALNTPPHVQVSELTIQPYGETN